MTTARAFAIESLRHGLLVVPTGQLRITPDWTELVLYRAGKRQIELIVLRPGAQVPRHAHSRCDSADLALAGDGAFNVGGQAFAFGGGRLCSVPRDTPHGGAAGPHGAAYLSFQVWHGEPGYIADDWTPA